LQELNFLKLHKHFITWWNHHVMGPNVSCRNFSKAKNYPVTYSYG